MDIPRAATWGKWLANFLSTRATPNPFLLAIHFGWRVTLENDDDASPGMPIRLAEWDGSRRLIRLFIPILQRHFGNSKNVLHSACAHELFHGLVAVNYHVLHLPQAFIPKLNYHEEEIAAQVFSEALINFALQEESCPLLVSR